MLRAVVYYSLRFARYFFWASVFVVMNACVTTTTGGFNESRFNNQKLADDFTRILTTLYQDSPEYAEPQQRMTDAN